MRQSLPGTRIGHRRGVVIGMAIMAIVICLLPPCASLAAQATPAGANANPPQAASSAQEPHAESNAPREPAKASATQVSEHSLITDREQLLSFSILIFGTFVLVVQYLLLRSPHRGAYEILQLLSINLIVTGTLFLISAGFDAQQIAPGLGLFGTVAGYVLGRKAGGDSSAEPPKPSSGGTP